MNAKKSKIMVSDFVTINPKVQGGLPVIRNTRVPVKDVVFLVKIKKIPPKEIALKYYSYLSLYQIIGAVKWYELNSNKYGGLDM